MRHTNSLLLVARMIRKINYRDPLLKVGAEIIVSHAAVGEEPMFMKVKTAVSVSGDLWWHAKGNH